MQQELFINIVDALEAFKRCIAEPQNWRCESQTAIVDFRPWAPNDDRNYQKEDQDTFGISCMSSNSFDAIARLC
jgi:hypothetical protein